MQLVKTIFLKRFTSNDVRTFQIIYTADNQMILGVLIRKIDRTNSCFFFQIVMSLFYFYSV